jgi:LacI family transcriptional regulator
LATEHLIEIGHRRIAFLSIPEDEDQADLARFEGYKQALLHAGLGPVTRIRWSPPADHASIDGREINLVDVFSGLDRVTAVFATYDVAAIALQEFADRMHLRVPEDLSIVGFDDVPTAGLARIALTTIAQPRDELAGLAIAAIADRIEQRFNGPPRTQLVGVDLVTRRSTAPPRPA